MVYWLSKPRGIVSRDPKASDLQAFRVLFQRPKGFIEPINHRNVRYIAFM